MSEQFNQYGATPQNNNNQGQGQGQGQWQPQNAQQPQNINAQQMQQAQNMAAQQAAMRNANMQGQNIAPQGQNFSAQNMQNAQQVQRAQQPQQPQQAQNMAAQQAPMRSANMQGQNMAPQGQNMAPQGQNYGAQNMQNAQQMQRAPQQQNMAAPQAAQNASSLQQQAQNMAAQQAAMRNMNMQAQPQAQPAQNAGVNIAAQMPQAQMQQQAQAQQPQNMHSSAPKQADGPGVQIILRMFQPDMNLLKVTARQLSELPHIKLNLYGQGGEVLVVVTAEGRTAPATELCENAAAQMEAAMGDVVYSRGKTPLAKYVAKLLNKNELNIMAPDEETGTLLEAEFKNVETADKIYDFGQDSYHHSKMANKIADAAIMDDEESDDPVQLSADRSFAAKKCTKADFGVSIASVQGKSTMAVAVTYGKYVYITSIKMAEDAKKKAVMSAFDMIRRLVKGYEIPYARTFKAAQEIDWNEPVLNAGNKGVKKSSDKSLVVPIIILIIVSIALGVGIWYVVQNFIITDESAMPVTGDTSTSQAAEEQQNEDSQAQDTAADTQTGEEGTGEADAQTGETADATTDTADGQATTSEQTGENGDSVVHPFA